MAGPATGQRSGTGPGGVRLALLATLFFATSAVLVRSATGFGPLEVAAYRLVAGAGFIALLAALTGTSLRPSGRRVAIAAAGLVAALHFAFYIGSLYHTTIAHSLVLVNLSPLLAVPLTVFLKEKVGSGRLPGIAVAIVGLGIMVGLEPTLTPGQVLGDLMALLAALAYAVYSLIGRSQRSGPNLLAYTFWVYLAAGVALLPLALWQRSTAPGPLPGAGSVLAVILLALLPTAAGHTLYNAALRQADTVTVNLIATQEVTGGVLLGFLVLGERPSLQALLGGLTALAGLYLFLRTGRPRSRGGREVGDPSSP